MHTIAPHTIALIALFTLLAFPAVGLADATTETWQGLRWDMSPDDAIAALAKRDIQAERGGGKGSLWLTCEHEGTRGVVYYDSDHAHITQVLLQSPADLNQKNAEAQVDAHAARYGAPVSDQHGEEMWWFNDHVILKVSLHESTEDGAITLREYWTRVGGGSSPDSTGGPLFVDQRGDGQLFIGMSVEAAREAFSGVKTSFTKVAMAPRISAPNAPLGLPDLPTQERYDARRDGRTMTLDFEEGAGLISFGISSPLQSLAAAQTVFSALEARYGQASKVKSTTTSIYSTPSGSLHVSLIRTQSITSKAKPLDEWLLWENYRPSPDAPRSSR